MKNIIATLLLIFNLSPLHAQVPTLGAGRGGFGAGVSNIQLIDSQVCSGTSSCNHAVTNNVNDLIVVIETNFNAACSTVPTDGNGDTFTNRYDFVGVVSEGHQCGFDTIAGASNQTVTVHGASFTSANIRVYRGISTGGPFDVVVGALIGQTNNRPGSRSLTGTTNQLAIGWCEDGSSSTNTFGTTGLWGNGIEYPQATAGERGFAADILNGKPGSQFGFAATSTNTHNFGCGEILYKSAVSGSIGSGNFPTEFTGLENSTDGTTLTTAILYAGMNGGNCVWTTAGTLTVATAGQKDTVLNVTADGTLNAAPFSGTRGVSYDPGNGGATAVCTFRQTHATVTAGSWWKSPATIPDTTTHSLLTITGSGGSDFADIAMSSSENFFRCETLGGTSGTLGFTIAASTWYRLTVKYVSNGTHTCSAYDISGTLLGTGTHAATGSNNAVSASIGNSHGSAGTPGNLAYQDEFMIDELNATFPLIP